MRGIGEDIKGRTGELTETNLNIISNDECYQKFLNQEEKNASRWKNVKSSVTQTLFDGITDQILCTTTACDPATIEVCSRRDLIQCSRQAPANKTNFCQKCLIYYMKCVS